MALPVEDAPGDISWNAEDDEDRSPNHGGRWQGGARGPGRLGYDHGYDAEVFYLGLALDERYVEGFVEGCLERIGENDPDEEDCLRTSGRSTTTGISYWRRSRAGWRRSGRAGRERRGGRVRRL